MSRDEGTPRWLDHSIGQSDVLVPGRPKAGGTVSQPTASPEVMTPTDGLARQTQALRQNPPRPAGQRSGAQRAGRQGPSARPPPRVDVRAGAARFAARSAGGLRSERPSSGEDSSAAVSSSAPRSFAIYAIGERSEPCARARGADGDRAESSEVAPLNGTEHWGEAGGHAEQGPYNAGALNRGSGRGALALPRHVRAAHRPPAPDRQGGSAAPGACAGARAVARPGGRGAPLGGTREVSKRGRASRATARK